MSEKKPVIVYGASGYTGRLVCEYLREYNIPFIAAGRSADKLNAAMKSNVAGIETADYEVVTVPHTVAALTELFKGASVARWSRPAWRPSATTRTPRASKTG
jgi:short subunit dehydrogenase-like uncharacterized protein